MFVNKGQLKVALRVVGVLVVGLGMYGAFQPEVVEAHRYTWTEIFMGGSPSNHHREKTETWTETTTVATYTWKVKCSVCGKDTVTKKSTEKRHTTYERKQTDHYSFSGVYLDNCHRHDKKSKGSRLSWSTTTSACSNSSCGG